MKKRVVALLALLLIGCMIGCAAEDAREALPARYSGGWMNEDYRMYVLCEDDGISARLFGVGGGYTWEFDHCWYDAEADLLYLPNYTRYRQRIDWDTMELVEEDWSTGDMAFTCIALEDDGETATVSDIPYIDESLTLRRVSDEEYFAD